jgi:hypothetical protein
VLPLLILKAILPQVKKWPLWVNLELSVHHRLQQAEHRDHNQVLL